jgi:hypothetical protein
LIEHNGLSKYSNVNDTIKWSMKQLRWLRKKQDR